MEWISVKDRLPEEGTYFIIAYDENDLDAGTFLCDYGRLCQDYRNEGPCGFYQGVYSYEEHMSDEFIDVTHWMPFPELPYKDNNESNSR